MELRLNLKNHCIASEVKNLYNKSVSMYLKKSQNKSFIADPELENKIELLKKALEQLDFPGLRNRYPILTGKTDSCVIVSTDSKRSLSVSIDNQKIKLLFLNEKKKCQQE